MFSTLPSLARGNAWTAIWPELTLGCLALALLLAEIVLPRRVRARLPEAALAVQAALLVAVLVRFDPAPRAIFGGLLVLGIGSESMRVFFLASSIFAGLLARIALAKQEVPRIEFYHVLLVVTAALMLLVESANFIMLFVSLETVTVGFYILVSYFRSSAATLEAGLKYLVIGALSSALLLFGIVLLYGAAGNRLLPGHTAESLDFEPLSRFLAANPHQFLAAAGIVLVLAGLAFKIGAFPFQFWIPDVYQGAPTPVTAFLAVASKAAGFVVLLTLADRVFAPCAWLVAPVLAVLTVATVLFGSLAALTQRNVKRLIGLSGVSHAGFLLLGVAAGLRSPLAAPAVFLYLFAYLFAAFAVFGVMAHLAGPDDADQKLEHYAGLARESPFLGAVLVIGLGSLAGIPPLAGFLGKFVVFVAAFQARLYLLLAIAVAAAVISIYYYFGWVRMACFEPMSEAEPRPARTPVGLAAGLALGALAVCSFAFVFYQGPLGAWLPWR